MTRFALTPAALVVLLAGCYATHVPESDAAMTQPSSRCDIYRLALNFWSLDRELVYDDGYRPMFDTFLGACIPWPYPCPLPECGPDHVVDGSAYEACVFEVPPEYEYSEEADWCIFSSLEECEAECLGRPRP